MQKKNLQSMDRLSRLPDDVIRHILSFLPTKSSVRTSILSKRWRCLWTRVPFLEFIEGVDSKIINKVMLQHKGNINTFNLECQLECQELDMSGYELESWIDNIIARNVRELCLILDCGIELPRCLFTCKTLVHLCLGDCGVGEIRIVDFPALKKLELFNIEFGCDESLPRLLFGCPVLEELSIDITGPLDKVVCSPTLTKLTISSSRVDYQVGACKMKLDAPALRYLCFCSYPYVIFSAGTLSSLYKADIDLYDDGDDFEEGEERMALFLRSVLELLGKMCNLNCLKFSTCDLMISYDAFSEVAPKFDKLTELKLGGDCGFITIFLENANSLRLLTIQWDHRAYRDLDWIEPKNVPACLTSHLEEVNLVNFGWSTEKEFDMIRYILWNGKVLKRMVITTRSHAFELDSAKKFDVLKRVALFEKVALFERGSQACRVDIN